MNKSKTRRQQAQTVSDFAAPHLFGWSGQGGSERVYVLSEKGRPIWAQGPPSPPQDESKNNNY
jgi:hypothetical protein